MEVVLARSTVDGGRTRTDGDQRMRNESLYGTVAVADDIGQPRDADGSAGL